MSQLVLHRNCLLCFTK